METLLSLTSKRAGDWFKEELRLLGGLDHIVDKGRQLSSLYILYVWFNLFCFLFFFPLWTMTAFTCHIAFRMWNSDMPCFCYVTTVKECVLNLSQEDDKESLVASLWGAERCLRVLESVSNTLITGSLHHQSHRCNTLGQPFLFLPDTWMSVPNQKNEFMKHIKCL